tara:strand:+ start:1542 stop:2015 length:474 start_codon:yes stop_codon:yes gene_type:complete
MNDKQKLFVMNGIGSFVVFLITVFGLGFLPYTVYYSKGYKSDPLMYLFNTKMREMVEREVRYQYDSYRADKDYRVKYFYKHLDDGEKIIFDRYVDDTIEYKKWKQSSSKKSYYLNLKQLFKSTPITNPTSPKTNWLGIIAVFSITFSCTGYFLFRNK